MRYLLFEVGVNNLECPAPEISETSCRRHILKADSGDSGLTMTPDRRPGPVEFR